MISRERIEEIVGRVEERGAAASTAAHPSPGMHPRHYSPATPLRLVEGGALPGAGRGAYLWLTHPLPAAHSEQMPADPEAYAAILYDTLHRLDEGGFEWIAVERPPSWPEWTAILDRLLRSSVKE
jgi:L-threonylcarbamoyladenylate synthase